MHDLPSARPTTARVLGVAVLTGALWLTPGGAEAHVGHHARPVNHAPDLPADVRTTAPDSACSATTPAPLRATTPTLRATLHDQDGDAVRATFEVRDGTTGRRLWSSGPTTPQPSGSEHAVQVPESVLRDGGAYEWRVQARDVRHRKSALVRCRVAVDTTAPGQATVTPVEGAGAVYAEDATAGGVGVAGTFRFEVPGATDVVAFLHAFDGAPARVDVAPGATGADVTWVPTSAGTHQLVVQAVDAAGNVGPERLYRFTVASAAVTPAGVARWTLDEGDGSTAADVLAPGGATGLTLSPSLTWTDGLRNELAGATGDRALLFDEPSDTALTAGPVLDTAASWSVAALVRPAAADVTATAVSQDGVGGAAVQLGASTTGCADDVPTCWALTVAGSAAGEATTVTSTVPVVAGAWYVLFGVRDAASGALRLDVCHLGTAAEPGRPVPVAVRTTHEGGVPAAGAFRVGGLQDGAEPWIGAISGVQTWGTAIDSTQERLLCSRGA